MGFFNRKPKTEEEIWQELKEYTNFSENFAVNGKDLKLSDLELFKKKGWELINHSMSGLCFSHELYYFKKV